VYAGDALAEKKYGPGVTDTEIKIGQTIPYSGPGSSYATIGRAQTAYFAKVNAEGGINGPQGRAAQSGRRLQPAQNRRADRAG
jgi:ABC-type branched-subunit amino acid transport system substrate-binding protein